MWLATVDNMHAWHSYERVETRGDLGNHATADDALVNELARFWLAQLGDQRAIRAADTRDVAQEDQLLSVKRACEMRGHQVGVDVQAGPVGSLAQRRDNRNVVLLDQSLDYFRVDCVNLADKTQF